MKWIFCLVALLCYNPGNAQTNNNTKPLNIGDTLPAGLVLTNVLNYPVSEIRLSDLRGKLVILDFWATWCGSCLACIPKAQELQKQFKDKVQIIMINSDTSEYADKVTSFFDKRNKRTGQKITLPYAVQNATFNDYFPHKEVPHYVWINEAGQIKGITTADEVTPENISAFLEDPSKTLYTKKDHLRFNRDKPLLIDENGGEKSTGFLYRSIITGYKENLGGLMGITLANGSDSLMNRLYSINAGILQLLQIAYQDVFKPGYGIRIAIETKNIDRNKILDPIISIKPENRYCYEIITSPTSISEIRRYMQEDILRYFKIAAKNETRLTDCYILRATPNVKKIKSSGGHSLIDIQENSLIKYIKDRPVSLLIEQVLQPLLNKPVLDETNLGFNIDMTIPNDYRDYSIENISEYLQANGLLLISSQKEIEIVVITDQMH